MHPTWEYRLWTDEANRELVREHYPWLLETYDSFPENIMRADTARVLYLHKYGGKEHECPGLLCAVLLCLSAVSGSARSVH